MPCRCPGAAERESSTRPPQERAQPGVRSRPARRPAQSVHSTAGPAWGSALVVDDERGGVCVHVVHLPHPDGGIVQQALPDLVRLQGGRAAGQGMEQGGARQPTRGAERGRGVRAVPVCICAAGMWRACQAPRWALRRSAFAGGEPTAAAAPTPSGSAGLGRPVPGRSGHPKIPGSHSGGAAHGGAGLPHPAGERTVPSHATRCGPCHPAPAALATSPLPSLLPPPRPRPPELEAKGWACCVLPVSESAPPLPAVSCPCPAQKTAPPPTD